MSEFKNYTSELYKLFEEFQKHSSNQYARITASGGDQFVVKMRCNKIEEMRINHDLSVHLTIGEKKNKKWRIYQTSDTEFDEILNWKKQTELFSNRAQNDVDPRPTHESSFIPESIPNVLPDYDPLIDGCDAALVYHRSFQVLSGFIENNIMVDAEIHYASGAHNWQYHPIPFTFVDSQNFYYKPQTSVDEVITLYPKDNPHQRQTICQFSQTLNQKGVLSEMYETFQTKVPMLRFNARNIDRIVLSPFVVAILFREILHRIELKQEIPNLSNSLDLMCDVSDPMFKLQGLKDVTGQTTEPVKIINHGIVSKRLSDLIRKSGHATDNVEQFEFFHPILRDSSENQSEYIFTTPLDYSKNYPGKILFLESPVILQNNESPVLLFKTGGAVYREGRYLGYVVGHPHAISLYDLLKAVMPISAPVRINHLGACALQVSNNLFFE